MDDSEWETNEQFTGREPILKWHEVEESKRFMVLSIQILKTNQSFKSYVMTYTDKDENLFKVWCPSHFVKQLQRNRKANFRPYFVSHGKTDTGSKSVAQFEIAYKIVDKSWDIFTDKEYEI